MSIINICINNVNREYYLEEGSSGIVLENIVKDIENEYKGYITLANINNKLRELSYKVKLELRLNILYQGDFIVKFIQIQNFKILI